MYLFSPFLHLNDCSVKKSMGTPLSPWTTVYISMSCWSDPPNSWEESWPIHPHRQRTSTRSGYWAFLPIHPHRRRTSTRVRLMGFLAWPPCFVFCWNTVEFQSRLWLSHLKKKKKRFCLNHSFGKLTYVLSRCVSERTHLCWALLHGRIPLTFCCRISWHTARTHSSVKGGTCWLWGSNTVFPPVLPAEILLIIIIYFICNALFIQKNLRVPTY